MENSPGFCSVAGCGSEVEIGTNNINDCDWVTPTSTPAPTNTPFPTPTPCVDQSPSAPGLSAPANGTVTNVSPQILSWTAPFSWGFECDGGYWNRYQVYSCVGANCYPGNILQEWTTNTSYSWGGLVSGTVYGWRVEATNGNKTTSSVIWYFTYDNEAPQCSSFTDSPDPLTMGQTLSTTPTFTDNVSVYQIEMYVIRPPTMRLKIIVS